MRDEREQDRLAPLVASVHVTLAARLGRASLTVRELLAMEVGSLVRLDRTPGAPIDVRIGDHVVLRGVPVVRGGNLALEIVPSTTVVERREEAA